MNSKNSKVFIPQVPSRYDRSVERWVPTVNLDPARQFGDLEIMLPPEAGRMAPQELVQMLERALKDITADDWLLATGDPVAMAITMALAARNLGGTLRILRWDKRVSGYEAVEVQV